MVISTGALVFESGVERPPKLLQMSEYLPNATLIYREDLTPELAVVRVKPDCGEVPPFEPGQYGELAVIEEPSVSSLATVNEATPTPRTKLARRAYSIASAKNTRDYFEFNIVLVPGGEVTEKLWKLSTGDRLWLGPKVKGKFTLDEVPAGRDLVAIATGTGLAPFVSMLRSYCDTPKWRRFVLIHGARLAADLSYRRELELLAKSQENFHYIPIVSREPDTGSWSGLRGRVQVVLEEGHYERITGEPFAPATCQILLCGNPAMIDSLEAAAITRGFKLHSKKSPGNIHLERYW